jgi:Protein of unknown function (DUF2838)
MNFENAKERLSRVRETVKLKAEQRFDALRARVKSASFVKMKDKISFVLGVLCLLVTNTLLCSMPDHMPLWYSCLVVPLIVTRFFVYHSIGFHFFLLDFCYFCSVLLLFYLWLYPTSALLFQLCFALCNGPLLFAIVLWRNSLVLHDLDKTTSLFIHLMPVLVTYSIRWLGTDADAFAISELAGEPSMSLMASFAVPLGFYCFWQAAYLVKTEHIDAEKLQTRRDLMTSVRWMSEIKPHPIYVMCRKKGVPLSAVSVLVSVQLVYTVLTLLPTSTFFHSFVAHTAMIAFVFVAATFNGASYYFESFAAKLLAKEKQFQQQEVDYASTSSNHSSAKKGKNANAKKLT